MQDVNEATESAMADMRGLINTVGIAKAALMVAEKYAAPGNVEEHATLGGFILAAYQAGQLDGVQRAVS